MNIESLRKENHIERHSLNNYEANGFVSTSGRQRDFQQFLHVISHEVFLAIAVVVGLIRRDDVTEPGSRMLHFDGIHHELVTTLPELVGRGRGSAAFALAQLVALLLQFLHNDNIRSSSGAIIAS